MTERCRRHALTYCEECHSDIQDDIAALLRALGISDHARPISPHAVVHEEILPAIASLTARAVRAEEERDRLRAEREMIADDTCFWYEDGGSPFFKPADDSAPRAVDPVIKICVNANDAFAWGTADAEPIPDDQFWRLYRIWQQFGHAGAIAWAMEHRGVEKLFMSYKEPFEGQLQAARKALTPRPATP